MGRAILLNGIEIPGIRNFTTYRSHGGYAAVEKALREMTPAQVAAEVTRSGLRGRGGASFLDKKSDKPRYLICNADES